jgi:hypothetical protein
MTVCNAIEAAPAEYLPDETLSYLRGQAAAQGAEFDKAVDTDPG